MLRLELDVPRVTMLKIAFCRITHDRIIVTAGTVILWMIYGISCA